MAKQKKNKNLNVQGFIDIMCFDVKKNRFVGKRSIKNMVNNRGLDMLASILAGYLVDNNGANIAPFTTAAVGISTAAPAPTQIVLQSIITDSVRVGTPATANLGTFQLTWSYNTNDLTQGATNISTVVGEVGLFDLDPVTSTGVLRARSTFPQTLKTTDMQMFFTYQLRFASQ